MFDLKAQYIAEWEACDTPDYRLELTRRELGWLGLGWVLTLSRASGATLARIHTADDGTVTVLTGKIEMGQGSRTIVTQAVAEELRVDPARVRVVMGDTSIVPDDGGTWASLTTPQTIPVIREAAAAMRHAAVTDAKDWKVLGTSLPPVAGRAIVTGAQKYASDFRIAGMKHACVVRAPAYKAKLIRYSAPPDVKVVRSGDLIGVIAADPKTAERHARLVKAEWETSELPSRAAMFAAFREKSIPPKPGEGGRYPALMIQGDAPAALDRAGKKHEATYEVVNIAHVPLEPRAAIAEWKDGKLTIWSGCQAGFMARKEIAGLFRIPETDVRIIAVEPGGAYGGKQRAECEIEAAWMAREAGAPVKLAWSRREEFTASYCRPAGIVDVSGAIDEKGRITAWLHRNYNSGAASLRPPYSIPDYRCEYHRSESPIRQGSYRSLAGVANTFAREAFVDELAAMAKIDPLEFRLKNTEDQRLRHVLHIAAERFGWGTRQGGVACTTEKDARLALFIEMSGEKVRRAVMAIDPGAILNPDNLRNQCEGGIVQGIGGALFEELLFDSKHLLNTRLSRYRVPRFTDAPEIEVILVDRRDIPSTGAGEAPITLVAPAIRAALRPTAERPLRSLPLLKTS